MLLPSGFDFRVNERRRVGNFSDDCVTPELLLSDLSVVERVGIAPEE